MEQKCYSTWSYYKIFEEKKAKFECINFLDLETHILTLAVVMFTQLIDEAVRHISSKILSEKYN